MNGRETLPPIRVGDVLSGKFEVEKILGVGGMGMVVAARHRQLDQRVALKFMLPQAMANAEATERFMREAKAAARLRSENVARVLDVGTLEDGSPYIVMELLEGQDAAGLLEKGPLPLGQAVGIVLQACAAVAEAHALGIVHRDLKPRNLFLTTDVEGKPLVKVLDFGISKDLGGPGTTDAPGSLTKTAMMLGSPHYMSPEQLKSSRDVDARADVWSLGVCLFELSSKKVPFNAPSIAELCAIVLAEKAPHLPTGPRELDAIVQRCLEKQPGDRFRTVADLATALEPFADAWAKPAAERARNVMKTSRATGPAAPSAAIPSDGTLATGPTVATWDTSVPGARKRRTWPLIAVAAVVAAAVIAIGLAAMSHHASPASPAHEPLPATATATATTATATATVTVTATATPTATPTPTASTKPAAPTKHPRPTPSAKPKSDDVLLEGRN